MVTYDHTLSEYVVERFANEDEILSLIRKQIPARGLPAITVKPEEGRFLQFLVAASGARLALEIGTLGGYSGVWIARGLGPEGRLVTLERNPKHAALARDHFQLAGLADKVTVLQGEAHELLDGLSAEGPFDFVFIDADKPAYPAYLEWTLTNLRPGGVLAAHNAFRHGAVVDDATQDPGTAAIRQFNQRLAQHADLISTIFPAGDGMAIAVLKR